MPDARSIISLLFIAFLLIGVSCGKHEDAAYAEPEGISWASVLRESFDLRTLVEPVEPYARSRHFSSAATTGKVGLIHLAQQTFGDMDHGYFLQVSETESGVDAVLAEVKGAGMITWIWSANPKGTLRLFIDDRETPVLEIPFVDFVDGYFLPCRYPYAAITSEGHNLHFPIIHSNYCRLEIHVSEKRELADLFYQVAWNELDATEKIESFDAGSIRKGKALLQEMAERVKNVERQDSFESFEPYEVEGNTSSVVFSSSVPGTISSIQLGALRKQDLTGLAIRAYWDDAEQPSIDCPLLLLAGVSENAEKLKALPVTVDAGCVTLRWPMPYETARIEIVNSMNRPAAVKCSVVNNPQSSELRFGTVYQRCEGIRLEDAGCIEVAELAGPGRIVGCNLIVKTDSSGWWGEGDVLIYLGTASEPSWHAPGTEDYFGFAWCSTEPFEHPFRGQSAVSRSGKNITTSLHRYHLLDRLPFHDVATLRMEIIGLAQGTANWESLVLFYSQR